MNISIEVYVNLIVVQFYSHLMWAFPCLFSSFGDFKTRVIWQRFRQCQWTLIGEIVWTTELHKTEEIDVRSASISKGVMSDESTPGVSASFS
jgi:transposase